MHDPDLNAALDAAAAASAYLMDAYARFEVVADAPADLTTECDRQAQEIVLKSLRARFPSDSLCAEEKTPTAAAAPEGADRVWIVDPIDGTRGFARKTGEFSVMIALVVRGAIRAGVVSQPALSRITYASAGGGCWRRDADGEPVRCAVGSAESPETATLTQSRSKTPGKLSPLVAALAPARIVETYSAGVKLALVARGEADVYVNDYLEFHDWDIAAGHILVSEAGGTVTGLGGESLRYGLPGAKQRLGLLATNGRIHAESVRRLAAVRR